MRPTRSRPRRAALLGTLACTLLLACSQGPSPSGKAQPQTPTTNGEAKARAPQKAHWSIPDRSSWVERSPDGVDRLIVGNKRVEAKGARVLAIASPSPEIVGAASFPAWTRKGEGLYRYVFFFEREVFVAKEWLGELTSLGKLPATVGSMVDFLDGTLLYTRAGPYLVRPDGKAPEAMDRLGGVRALAVDESRAIVLSAFGRARLTLDGGKTYRDISGEAPEPFELEVRGDALAVLLRGGGRRVLGDDGKLKAVDAPTGLRRHEPPPDLEDRWPDDALGSALETATQNGLMLPDGDALTAYETRVARVDLETGRTTALFVPETSDSRCEPFRAKDALLLVCESPGSLRVLQIEHGGRIERTFELPVDTSLDRFVAVDEEALAFLGPCDGLAPPSPADVVTGASPTNASPQRSPVLCVRKSADTWIEHRLDPADASDVVAWIPRVDGGAVALVAVPGTFVTNMPRISEKGGLRVVRVARNEPPLDVSTYAWDSGSLLSRSLRTNADGSIVGWIGSAHAPSALSSVTVDPQGRTTQHALPSRATRVSIAGRRALVSTEDHKLFQTLDYGKTFTRVEPPPGATSNIEPLSCTEVGCRVAGFVRTGWDEAPDLNVVDAPPPAQDLKRPMPEKALVRLACRFTGEGETKRQNESFGLGVTPSPMPRMSPGRIGFTGALQIPWNGPQISPTADAEVSFVRLFDLTAQIVRQTVPLSRLGPTPFHPFDLRLGYLLDGPNVTPLAAASYSRCAAALVDEAGLTTPTGGCVHDPTVGVVIENHATLVHQAFSKQVISSMELGARGRDKPQKRGQKTLPHAPRELVTRFLPENETDIVIGVGDRKGSPVVVAVGGGGQTVLATINPKNGDLGAEETLAPLTALLAPNDPRCKPSPDDARVLLPFTTHIGLREGSLLGVSATGSAGLAILRWSSAHVCLQAVELSVRDERFEPDVGYYDPPGTVRKLIAKLEGNDAGKGTLVVLGYGTEVRQPLVCDGVVP